MRTLFDPQEALTNARTLLKTPQRFQEWLSADPDRLFRADRKSGTNALVRFLTEARVAGVHQGSHHIYVGMTPLELPAWTEYLDMPADRGFLARYLIWRLEEASAKEAA
ncbi:MAG: hypothetical protein NVS2B12_35430 [Ktedonobacteraceae bacterium]